MTDELRPETIAAGHGIGDDPAYRAVSPPVYLSSTYVFAGYERPGPYDYGRAGNPSRDLLGEALATLEGGAGAIVTSSGLAALDLLLSILAPDQILVAQHDCYGGTLRLLRARADQGRFHLRIANFHAPDALGEALDGAALVLIETPSNPLMRIIDIAAVARQAATAGARIAVDNTFLSPALQQPIALGADFVIHSTTKFLNGHSDVIGGAVVAKSEDDLQHLRTWANVTGVSGSPFDAWLTLRGLRTLFARIERQERSARRIAGFLAADRRVSAVHYPGLPFHPGHATAARQQRGFGAMLSFELAGGAEAVRSVIEAVRVFTLAESLGGIESLIAHPATMTHANMPEEDRRAAGIGGNLLRLSVGLEHEEDLIADLDQALSAADPAPMPLCRFEELAMRENQLRVTDAQRSPPG